jgi:DNA-directed RNA polymerase specialized sigma24 family protein
MGTGPTASGDKQIDWPGAISFLKQTLGRLVARSDSHLIEMLAGDAGLRLVRVARREKIKSPETMMTTIAYRVYGDWKRKLGAKSQAVLMQGDEIGKEKDIPGTRPGRTPRDVDLGAREWRTFKALEMIHRVAGGKCHEYLAAYYSEKKEHAEVAEQLGVKVATARKRKSRCEATILQWIEENPDHATSGDLRAFLERFEV